MFASRARPCEEATIRSTSTARTGAVTAKPWVLLATILASSMAYIDESVVNVALPAIETDLAVSVAVIQWLVNAYTLCPLDRGCRRGPFWASPDLHHRHCDIRRGVALVRPVAEYR